MLNVSALRLPNVVPRLTVPVRSKYSIFVISAGFLLLPTSMRSPTSRSIVILFSVLMASTPDTQIFSENKYHMQGETNIFLRGLKAAPAPWQHKTVNRGLPDRRDEIVDYEGNNIIDLTLPGGNYTTAQYRNTIALTVNAPRMLAALIELAYNQKELAGVEVDPKLLQLIADCGGPDLTPTEEVVEPKPQTWNNATQSSERLLG